MSKEMREEVASVLDGSDMNQDICQLIGYVFNDNPDNHSRTMESEKFSLLTEMFLKKHRLDLPGGGSYDQTQALLVDKGNINAALKHFQDAKKELRHLRKVKEDSDRLNFVLDLLKDSKTKFNLTSSFSPVEQIQMIVERHDQDMKERDQQLADELYGDQPKENTDG